MFYQFLRTDFKRSDWNYVRRVNILSVGVKRFNFTH